ncbi:MAG: thymidylate synthase [Candidatus Aenigmatarchaeota archaeon]
MKDMIEKIKNQIGSNGEMGWPVAMRDRIAFPSFSDTRVTDSNIGLTFLWTMRDAILPKLDKEKLAIATNFYTPAGLEGMVRNILGNPFIQYIILLGEEYSNKSKNDQISELTSANAIRAFFNHGLDNNRKVKDFENSVHFDKNIPTNEIENIRKNVQLIDLNKKMPLASLDEKIAEANHIMKTLTKKPIFQKPATFPYEQSSTAFPYEGGPIIIHGSTIPDSWIKMIYNIHRHGHQNLMNANTDRWVKEINTMIVVVHDPQNMDLSLNPFLVPLTKEKIEAYKKEILSPLLPPGKAYTYGNKLRAYYYPSAREIIELVNTKEYKDFEFKQGPWLDANVIYKNKIAKSDEDLVIDTTEQSKGLAIGTDTYCEIDQIQDIIDVLKKDPYSKACVAMSWHPADELMRKHKSSPCLVLIQAMVQNEKLNLMVFFRSHDMTQGWPENTYGAAAIQKIIADGIGIEPGLLTMISGSAQIYNHYYQQIENMLKKYHSQTKKCSDSRGNYRIEIKDNQIVVTLLHPETGKELESFSGKTAYELRDKIADSTSLTTGHAIYLGTELAIAELALKKNIKYVQDEAFEPSKELH